MREVHLNEEDRARALIKKMKSLEIYAKQSVSGYDPELDKNDSWYTGGLGEVTFEHEFPNAVFRGKSGYDYFIGGYMVEVKSNRWYRASPTPESFFLVSAREMHRASGIFVFAWVMGELYYEETGWVVGWLPVEDFLKTARLRKKGERQEHTGMRYSTDSYEILLKEAHEIEILQILTGQQYEKGN